MGWYIRIECRGIGVWVRFWILDFVLGRVRLGYRKRHFKEMTLIST